MGSPLPRMTEFGDHKTRLTPAYRTNQPVGPPAPPLASVRSRQNSGSSHGFSHELGVSYGPPPPQLAGVGTNPAAPVTSDMLNYEGQSDRHHMTASSSLYPSATNMEHTYGISSTSSGGGYGPPSPRPSQNTQSSFPEPAVGAPVAISLTSTRNLDDRRVGVSAKLQRLSISSGLRELRPRHWLLLTVAGSVAVSVWVAVIVTATSEMRRDKETVSPATPTSTSALGNAPPDKRINSENGATIVEMPSGSPPSPTGSSANPAESFDKEPGVPPTGVSLPLSLPKSSPGNKSTSPGGKTPTEKRPTKKKNHVDDGF